MAAVQPATTKPTAVIEKERSSGLNVMLHPLVILNISDHFTRVKMSGASAGTKLIGALVGTQTGRMVEIHNSFELVLATGASVELINPDYFKNKQDQFKKVFPLYDILGWYSTGSEARPGDLEIHKQIMTYNESPLFLLLDPLAASTSKELPITIFESELHIINDSPTMMFAKTPYKIETGEAERIAVDHIAHVTAANATEGSKLTAHLMGLHNAIKMLNIRVKVIVQFLEATHKGQIPTDHTIVRQIASLCNQLPAMDSSKFKDEFLLEYIDALLVTYLATITKTCSNVNELVDKFNTAFDRQGRRSRFF